MFSREKNLARHPVAQSELPALFSHGLRRDAAHLVVAPLRGTSDGTVGYAGGKCRREAEIGAAQHLLVLNMDLLSLDFRIGTVHLIPVVHNQFDADEDRFTVGFIEGPEGEISELKLTLGRVRNLRYKKTTLPVES